jgi:hypothetical protein
MWYKILKNIFFDIWSFLSGKKNILTEYSLLNFIFLILVKFHTQKTLLV